MSESGSSPSVPAGILREDHANPTAVCLCRPEAETSKQPSPPDPEVVGQATRRRYSLGFKRRILREVEQADPGEVGAILRREGLYYSTLRHFRQQQEEGLLDLKAAKRTNPKPTVSSHSEQLAALVRENRALQHQLKQTQLVLDIQKKPANS